MISKADFTAGSLIQESPEYARTSFAAAIALGLMQGRFFRDAKLYCLNFLLTYRDGCVGRCAYCGLSQARRTSKAGRDQSFIRVDWPTVKVDDVLERIDSGSCSHVERACISMVTHKRALNDTLTIVRRLHEKIDAISALIAPTIIDRNWLLEAKTAGTDRIGIAIDAATPELFQKFRGQGVLGPHRWERYWKTVEEAVQVFGRMNVGIHLIVGLGETEREMIETIQIAYGIGSLSHLFSFFPEEGSQLRQHPQPPIGSYRRVQLAQYLINKGMISADKMKFNKNGRLVDFGIDKDTLDLVINSGLPFMTTGCSTANMENACNRPYSDSTPYQAYVGELRNFPFTPDQNDMNIVRRQIWDYSDTPTRIWAGGIDCQDCLSTV